MAPRKASAPGRSRTRNLVVRSHLLYPLSYGRIVPQNYTILEAKNPRLFTNYLDYSFSKKYDWAMDISQKIDLLLAGQRKLQTLVDRVEISLLNEIVKNRKQIVKNSQELSRIRMEMEKTNKSLKSHEERISSLETSLQAIAA